MMRLKNIWKLLLLAPVVALAANSCSKYEAPDNQHFVDYGTAYLKDEGSRVPIGLTLTAKDFNILRDDGAILNVVEDTWMNFVPEPDDRVYVQYTVLSQKNDGPKPVLDIKIFRITDVRCKSPLYKSRLDDQSTEYQLGNDPIVRIKEMRYSGKYVNFVYEYLTSQPVNFNGAGPGIELLIDDVSATEDQVTIYICHNANGDTPEHKPEANFRNVHSKEISIDLSSLLPDPETKERVKINFVWKQYKDRQWQTTEEVSRPTTFQPYEKAIQHIVW